MVIEPGRRPVANRGEVNPLELSHLVDVGDVDEVPEGGVAGPQLLERTLVDDPAVLQEDEAVGVAHGRQPVGDGDHRELAAQRPQRARDPGFGHRVQRRRGLVEHEESRPLVQRPGDAQALALAAGEPHATLADDGLQAGR